MTQDKGKGTCNFLLLILTLFIHPTPPPLHILFFRLVRYKCTTWPIVREDAVSACFDHTGQHLYVMHRVLPPVLYDLWHEEARLSFMDNTGSYKNIVTMKSGCFMGQNDEVSTRWGWVANTWSTCMWTIVEQKDISLWFSVSGARHLKYHFYSYM